MVTDALGTHKVAVQYESQADGAAGGGGSNANGDADGEVSLCFRDGTVPDWFELLSPEPKAAAAAVGGAGAAGEGLARGLEQGRQIEKYLPQIEKYLPQPPPGTQLQIRWDWGEHWRQQGKRERWESYIAEILEYVTAPGPTFGFAKLRVSGLFISRLVRHGEWAINRLSRLVGHGEWAPSAVVDLDL
jgi:hypothetical protein